MSLPQEKNSTVSFVFGFKLDDLKLQIVYWLYAALVEYLTLNNYHIASNFFVEYNRIKINFHAAFSYEELKQILFDSCFHVFTVYYASLDCMNEKTYKEIETEYHKQFRDDYLVYPENRLRDLWHKEAPAIIQEINKILLKSKETGLCEQ